MLDRKTRAPNAETLPPLTLSAAHGVARAVELRSKPVRRIVTRVGGSPGAAKFCAVREMPGAKLQRQS